MKLRIYLLLSLYISCTNQPRVEMSNGIAGDCLLKKQYYQNGQLAEQGNVCNGLKEGVWKEYYQNGKLKFEGRYINGTRIYNSDSLIRHCSINISDMASRISIDSMYKLQIKIPGLHPDDLIVTCTNGSLISNDSSSDYQYLFRPLSRGVVKIKVYYQIYTDTTLICQEEFVLN